MRLKLKPVFDNWSLFPIIGIAFLLPAIWLRERLVIAYAESGFFHFVIDPFRTLNVTPYSWRDVFGLGVENTRALPLVSYSLITSSLRFLGFSAVARQYLLFSAILFLSALSAYSLILELFQDKEEKPQFIALMAALFYILNPYTMYVWHRFVSSMFGLPVMPLIFLVFVKMLKKLCFKYAFLFAIITLLFSANAVNPAYFIPLFLPAIFYAIFETLTVREFKQWKTIGLGILLTMALISWWMLPLSPHLQSQYIRAGTVIDSTGTLEVISQWTPLLFTLRLIDTAFIHWYGVDYSPGWIEFLIPALAITAILFGKRDKDVIFFSLLLVIGLFLGKGLQPPGGFIFNWMFHNVPFFKAFRNPFDKFGLIIAFSYSFLVPFGIHRIWQQIKNTILKAGITTIILILLFGVSVWPMWTGDVFSFYRGRIPKEAKDVPTTRVRIPNYWREAASYINQDKENYRIVFLPQSPFDVMWYRWQYGYAGAEFGSVDRLFDNPVIAQLIGNPYADAYRKMVLETIFLTKRNMNSQLLRLMNVRYILVRNDVNESTIKTVPLMEIHRLLSSVESIGKIQSFGRLDLYEISDEYFLPHIYPASATTLVSSDINSLILLTHTFRLNGSPAILFAEQQDAKVLAALLNKTNAIIIPEIITSSVKPSVSSLESNTALGTLSAQTLDLIKESGRDPVSLFSVETPSREPVSRTIYIPRNSTRIVKAKISPNMLESRVYLLPEWSHWRAELADSRWEIASGKPPAMNHRPLAISYQLFDLPLVKVDGQPITFRPPGDRENLLDRNGYWLEPQKIHLTEGLHEIEILDHPTFKVDLVEVANKPYEPEEPKAKVEFRKINPTRYNVIIDAQESFWLVFSESFHEGWHAYIDGPQAKPGAWYRFSALLTWLFEERGRQELTDHYLVNAYANGWYVPQTGKHTITLDYTPQRLFETGVVISLSTLIGCVSYLVWDRVRRRN